jgi:tRNA nucleotidyltransferase/poly(A) polymerase
VTTSRQPLDIAGALARLEPVRRAVADLLEPTAVAQTALVGGIVRDAFLDRELLDIDLVTTGDAEPIARLVARTLHGAAFPLGEDHGCWRVVIQAPPEDEAWAGVLQVDVCGARGESLEADLHERDFTANALAVPLDGDAHIVDVHGGLADIEAGVVRMVSEQALDADPLRLLRAARFAHVLGWTIDPATADAVRARAARMVEPAGERTFVELRQLLLHGEARRGWRLLAELDLEQYLLPELHACRGVVQSQFHHLDVYEHTLAVLDNAEDLLAATDFWLPLPGEPNLGATAWSETQRLVVLIAALAHDLAKPATRSQHVDGRVGFAGHDKVGMAVVDDIAERWKLSGTVRTHVRRLVGTHLDLGFLLHTPAGPRETWRWRRSVAPVAAEAVVLSVADRMATSGIADRRRWFRAHHELARRVWVDHWREVRDGRPVPLLDGTAIGAELGGVAPGPQIGVLVQALAEEQAVGAVTTVAEAGAFVRSYDLSESTGRST